MTGWFALQILLSCALIASETKEDTSFLGSEQARRSVTGLIQLSRSSFIVPRGRSHSCNGCESGWAVSVLCVVVCGCRRVSASHKSKYNCIFPPETGQNISRRLLGSQHAACARICLQVGLYQARRSISASFLQTQIPI